MLSTLFPLLLLASASVAEKQHHKRATVAAPVIAGYYAGYNQYALSPGRVDYKDLTHFDFFVAETIDGFGINLNTTLNADAVIKDAVARAKQAKVKTSLVIGGWSGSRYFSSLFATAAIRKSYATSLQKIMKQYGFDGIEIDWEWPGSPGIGNNAYSPADSANFLLFLTQLRTTLGKTALITISVPAGGLKDANGASIQDYSAWAKPVNYFKIMAYDMNGLWGPTTITSAPVAPLVQCYSGAHPQSVSASVTYWKKSKIPGNQLILIVPGYGTSYNTKYTTLKKITTTTGRTSQAFQPLFNQNSPVGNVTYSGLIGQKLLTASGAAIAPYKRYYDACTSTPFLWNSKLTSFITYDDPDSIAAKAAFAKQQGLAGISLFELSQDNGGALIKAAKAAFVSGKASNTFKRDLGDMLQGEL